MITFVGLVNINIYQSQVASEVSFQQHIVTVRARAKEAVYANY